LNVHLQLPDLQNRARAGCLDFGDTLHPTALRELCCDAVTIQVRAARSCGVSVRDSEIAVC
jgi:hypothetical protein